MMWWYCDCGCERWIKQNKNKIEDFEEEGYYCETQDDKFDRIDKWGNVYGRFR